MPGHGQEHSQHAAAVGQRAVSWEGVVGEGDWEQATRASSQPQSVQFEELQQQQEAEDGWAGAGGDAMLPAVPADEVRSFCDTIGVRVFKISAKTGARWPTHA